MKTIKIVKAADRNKVTEPVQVAKTEQQVVREMTGNVTGWVKDMQTRKAQAPGAKAAFHALFAN